MIVPLAIHLKNRKSRHSRVKQILKLQKGIYNGKISKNNKSHLMDHTIKIKLKCHQNNTNKHWIASGLCERTKKNSLNLKKKGARAMRNKIICLWILQTNWCFKLIQTAKENYQKLQRIKIKTQLNTSRLLEILENTMKSQYLLWVRRRILKNF